MRLHDSLWTGHFAIFVRSLLGWRFISSLHSVGGPQQGRSSCPLLRSCFIGSCHVGVSKRFSRNISLQSIDFIYSFWLTRALVDPTLAAFYGMRSLAVYITHIPYKSSKLSENLNCRIKLLFNSRLGGGGGGGLKLAHFGIFDAFWHSLSFSS